LGKRGCSTSRHQNEGFHRHRIIARNIARLQLPDPVHASMLADTSLPRGSDVDLSIAGTLSERFRQVVAFPL
jgi:hypothetical protein